MSNTVKIIDNLSGTVLFEAAIEKIDEAYNYAAKLEEEGLDIRIEAPGLAETLIRSLGANDQEIAKHQESLEAEIDSHDDDLGCAICPPSEKTRH